MRTSVTTWLLLASAFAFTLALAGPDVGAAPRSLTVHGGKQDQTNVVVRVPLDTATPAGTVSVTLPDGRKIPGQITGPSLLETAAKGELWFVLPELKAGAKVALQVTDAKSPSDGSEFAWSDTGKHAELAFANRPVMRYMYEALDKSTPERIGETYKVYHHVYDPRGKRFVTKGPGGKFPHHRGLFFGFNRISYGDGKRADIWHCRSGESQAHNAFVATETGPVLGRHRLEILWKGQDEKPFANELREMTAYHVPGGTLIEFSSRLTTLAGPVKLDGDPQHAGFQFRASQHVPDKTAKLTYYLRPDGKGQPGKFRNWSGKSKAGDGNKEHVNLPWNALSFVIDDQRYTCCYIDRPQNPKEARFSERDYGRFGSYFEYQLTEDSPLQLNYRIWLQEGEMTVDEVNRLSSAFVDAPQTTAK
ncbi:MAG TPA: hypothetical protein DCY79_20480 [Planctomycetaceae bacterium]|nr:hypothetical protein [Blastopirellula sp.]HAY82189.1 hypothetical protein [Planctomycetaceae bacterium]